MNLNIDMKPKIEKKKKERKKKTVPSLFGENMIVLRVKKK